VIPRRGDLVLVGGSGRSDLSHRPCASIAPSSCHIRQLRKDVERSQKPRPLLTQDDLIAPAENLQFLAGHTEILRQAHRLAVAGYTLGTEEKKVFFFEKKKQKTFACCCQPPAQPGIAGAARN
jgi:hypothetical protein